MEKGILDDTNEKNIDLLSILPGDCAELDTSSEGRSTKLLTLYSEIPILPLD